MTNCSFLFPYYFLSHYIKRSLNFYLEFLLRAWDQRPVKFAAPPPFFLALQTEKYTIFRHSLSDRQKHEHEEDKHYLESVYRIGFLLALISQLHQNLFLAYINSNIRCCGRRITSNILIQYSYFHICSEWVQMTTITKNIQTTKSVLQKHLFNN